MAATVNAFNLGYDNVVDKLQTITGLRCLMTRAT
jgi:hypothetical protein